MRLLSKRSTTPLWGRPQLTPASPCLLLLTLMVGSVLPGRGWAQQAPTDSASIARGRELYQEWCSQCHGDEGAGNGTAADFLQPRPRDFTASLFKVRSTLSSELPTDQDLFTLITRGMPGTSMPGWAALREKERWELVAYVKTLAPRFASQTEPPQPIEMGEEPQPSPERLSLGKELYELIECWKCHGPAGRGDGPSAPDLKDQWGYRTWPADLTKPWTFRGGATARDIFRTMYTGLAGTPMPSFADVFGSPEGARDSLWALALYVRGLGPAEPPQPATVIRLRLSPTELPLDPRDPQWETVPRYYLPLVGQVVVPERWFTPSITDVTIRALYNEQEIAFLLTWNDRSQSLPDAIALQFPTELYEGGARPYFIAGDVERPVELWQWTLADSTQVRSVIARGLGKEAARPPTSQRVTGRASYQDGQYRLVFKRARTTPEGEPTLQFVVGKFIPLAVHAWDGETGETDSRRAISTWYYMILEPSPPPTRWILPPLAAGLLWGLELLVVRRVRRRARGRPSG